MMVGYKELMYQKPLIPDCINIAIFLFIQSGYYSVELLQCFFSTKIFNFPFSIFNSLKVYLREYYRGKYESAPE